MKIPLLFFVLFVSISACKKDNGTSIKIENPMQTILTEKVIVNDVFLNGGASFEFGQKIYFSVDGKITKLGCKMGDKGSFRVSLWDFSSQALIAATTITVNDSLSFFYNDISPILIASNTKYIVSVNNTSGGVWKSYYVYSDSTDLLSPIYPFTRGSITYESDAGYLGSNSQFPTLIPNSKVIVGVVDLQFESEQ